MTRIPLIVEPDRDDPECAEVKVDGSIAGRPYRFILDTGAARTHVVADDFTATLPMHGKHSSSGVFAAGSSLLVTLPELVVGPVVVLRVDAVLVDATQPGAQNLLGMDVLKGHCCHFRFDSETLVLDAALDVDGMRPLHMDDGSHPYVEVSWPDVTAQCVWDSGAGITIVDHTFWQRHPNLFEAAGTSVGTDATGTQSETPTFVMAEAEIGGEHFARHRVAVVDLSRANATLDRPMDLILGYTTLRQADWLFDFPARRWAITRLRSGGVVT
jgi:gag-polyprotein putative aspartyl protease